MRRLFVSAVLITAAAFGDVFFDPNVIHDVNDLVAFSRMAFGDPPPSPPRETPFNVIGISNELVTDVNDLTVEVLMLTDGRLYLLHNPDSDFSKGPLPSASTVHYGPIKRFYPATTVWSDLHRGVNTVQAAKTDDPNSYFYNFVDGYTAWQMQVMDCAGTGRSFGIGIDGVFDSVSIVVSRRSGLPKRFDLAFQRADGNKDGCVDLRDLADYSSQWLEKTKLKTED